MFRFTYINSWWKWKEQNYWGHELVWRKTSPHCVMYKYHQFIYSYNSLTQYIYLKISFTNFRLVFTVRVQQCRFAFTSAVEVSQLPYRNPGHTAQIHLQYLQSRFSQRRFAFSIAARVQQRRFAFSTAVEAPQCRFAFSVAARVPQHRFVFDLSSLVSCWSSVYIRRIIYKIFKCVSFWLHGFCG